MPESRLILGDCREVLPTIPTQTIDVVLCDPPYPHIRREYGYWTEAEWFEMMRAVVPECMRILKPTGSAVFILQPNSERVGRMRTWLWEFMTWVGKEWGIVQDAWWWNNSSLPLAGSNKLGLLRPSLKACAWVGSPDCYRNQGAVLLPITERRLEHGERYRRMGLTGRTEYPSGISANRYRTETAALDRGGTTPFNVLPFGNGKGKLRGGDWGHGASTPFRLCDWWLRYLCPPGGTACDPFAGSGTVGVAALKQGKSFIGIESLPKYHAIASARLAAARPEPTLFA